LSNLTACLGLTLCCIQASYYSRRPAREESDESDWSVDDDMSTWVGRTIGGHQIAEEIGRGGMAVVCRAYQPQLERWVAIKILRVTDATREEFLARFRREARAIAALRHPNILTIYDYGEEAGSTYIVMEYVPGGSLKACLTGQPMEWPDAATLIIPVGRALAYAHSQGVVHRDVKPANVLLARPDWPLLADFGLAKLVGRQRGITRPGTSLGTPAYFSPEQAAGEEVDHRSDVYSLALLLYELLTGVLPFKSESPYDTMLRRLYESATPPRHLNPRITPRLETVILQALDRDPAVRYPTMEALVDDLSRLPGATGRVAAPGPNAPEDRPQSVAAGSVTTRLGQSPRTTGPHLVVVGTGATIHLPILDHLILGRADQYGTLAPEVDLEPHGGSQAGVSRRHARMTHTSDGWQIEDLESTNGTFVNRTRLAVGQSACVRSGDTIRCGQLALTFHEE
jgi:serine/threonine protein kinase